MDSPTKFNGENFECFPLDWDTEYFGVRSARVNLKGTISEESQDMILDYCTQFDFITISNIYNLNENNYWIGKKTNAFLTDMNIQFTKKISGQPDFADKHTEIYNLYPRNEKVIHIAKSAFSYSRFFNDPRLPTEQARHIYLHWTECAFEQSDKYFIISRNNNEVVGYILFSINNENTIATIELIAVDEEYRGQGIGKALTYSIESFAYNNGIAKIKVGTQIDNISAAQFYISCGFRYVSCNSVYHLWIRN